MKRYRPEATVGLGAQPICQMIPEADGEYIRADDLLADTELPRQLAERIADTLEVLSRLPRSPNDGHTYRKAVVDTITAILEGNE